MEHLIAFDIGATNCRVALFEQGKIVWRAESATPGTAGPDATVAVMSDLCSPLRTTPARVGVAITGQIIDGYVSAHNVNMLPGWHGYPLQTKLTQILNRTVAIINDARAAALAEHLYGAGKGYDDFLFVTISSGVGAGVILGGRLHLARNGLDAELGETLCLDGLTLEQHASGISLHSLALQSGYASGKLLCEAADQGDAQAEHLYRHGIREVAKKLADLAVLLGIMKVAVGGGLGLRPGYLERLAQEMGQFPALYQFQLVRAELGHDAGLYGAAAWTKMYNGTPVMSK